MAVSTRRGILNDLKIALETISVANGYQSNVQEVRRGAYSADQMLSRPALCFFNVSATTEESSMSGQSERTLTITIRGYVDVTEEGDYDPLDKLMADVEKLLMTPASWSWQEWTQVGSLRVYEGLLSENVGAFEMDVQVMYRYDWALP
jgi:hypothetical protein